MCIRDRVYCGTGPITLPALRWELFRSKNLEGEMLPPTRGALLPHVMHANYIAMRDKSYSLNCPNLPPMEQNGWNLEDDCYLPVRCLTLLAPKAVLEMRKCGCKHGAVEEDVLATRMHFLAHLSVNVTTTTVRIWSGMKLMTRMTLSNSSC